MTLFHSLRRSPWLARLALLWFVLAIGVAVASPVVHPQSELVICTGVGMQKVVLNDDGTISKSAATGMSCPLCMLGGAPPSPPALTIVRPPLLSEVLNTKPIALVVSRSAVPSPARGPPLI